MERGFILKTQEKELRKKAEAISKKMRKIEEELQNFYRSLPVILQAEFRNICEGGRVSSMDCDGSYRATYKEWKEPFVDIKFELNGWSADSRVHEIIRHLLTGGLEWKHIAGDDSYILSEIREDIVSKMDYINDYYVHPEIGLEKDLEKAKKKIEKYEDDRRELEKRVRAIIDEIRETKSIFKSKRLALIREELERALHKYIEL